MQYPFFASPNYTAGRKKKIRAIILHRTFGSLEETVDRCFNFNSLESYHFIVSKEGKIVQLIKVRDTAWHAGWISSSEVQDYLKPNPNLCSIGIAVEDSFDRLDKTSGHKQEAALLDLIKDLSRSLKIKIHPDYVMGHCAIDPKRNSEDPGRYINWDQIYRLAGCISYPKTAQFLADESGQNDDHTPKLYDLTNGFVIDTFIEKIFGGLLERKPSVSEMDYYKHSGLDISQIVRKIIKSEEFKSKLENNKFNNNLL